MLLFFSGVLLLTTALCEPLSDTTFPPDPVVSTTNIIRRHGYTAEEHENVETPDGYLLTLHRIPYGKSNVTNGESRPVVFLMHDLMTSSADWVTMGPEKSLGYLLADAGYDVWMGNARGNKYSRKHSRYNPDVSSDYWQFSWHEIGVKDLPTMIDYVLAVTKQEKIFYVGHSQGTTVFFVMTSERPVYNEKIQLMVALAPVVYMNHLENVFLQLLAPFSGILGIATNLIGINEFAPSSELFQLIGGVLCHERSPIHRLCTNIIFLIYGWDSEQFNQTMLPEILANVPAGASTKQFLHYAQEISSGKFCQYDYGFFGNPWTYKARSPPEYNLGNAIAPVALFYSENDKLSSVIDVKKLAGKLQNMVPHLIPYKKFNHLDYLYAINAKELVYNPILDLLKQYPIH